MAKNNRPAMDLKEEVAPLLEQTVSTEAEEKVWAMFEDALSNLDGESILILRDFFAGRSLAEMSQTHRLSEGEVAQWIEKSRRELISQLQRKANLRQ